MFRPLTPRKPILLYLWLTLAFSAVAWTLILWSGHLNMGLGMVLPALMWCPALAALVACRMLGRECRSLGWHWPNSRYLAAAYFLPIGYASLAYGTVWALRLAGWNSEFASSVVQGLGLKGLPALIAFALYIVLMATGGVIQNLALTLGEEIGWRGFLLPELAKGMSFTKASLISGIVWAAWHTPLLLFADYNVGTNRWYELVCFTVSVVSVSFILAWLRLKSKSVWPAALLHATHNLVIPVLFDNLTRNTGSTLWYTTEFGVALAITSTICALYFWARRAEVQQTAAEPVASPAVAFVSRIAGGSPVKSLGESYLEVQERSLNRTA